jgi:hypothetical protein
MAERAGFEFLLLSKFPCTSLLLPNQFLLQDFSVFYLFPCLLWFLSEPLS